MVDAPNEVRTERVKKRSGLTDEQVQARMNEQLPMQEKRSLSDFVIENGATLDALAESVEKIATIIEALPDPEEAIS